MRLLCGMGEGMMKKKRLIHKRIQRIKKETWSLLRRQNTVFTKLVGFKQRKSVFLFELDVLTKPCFLDARLLHHTF